MSKHNALSAVVSSELVSCPFCGSDKIMCEGDGRSEMAWMCCQKCLAQGPAVWTRRGLTSKSARVRWNERAAKTKICHAMKTDTTKPKTQRNRVGSRDLVSLLSEWERVAFCHESVFLGRFCHEAWQLVGVYWGSEKMEVVYVLDSGQHITDSIPLNEWLEFYEANT